MLLHEHTVLLRIAAHLFKKPRRYACGANVKKESRHDEAQPIALHHLQPLPHEACENGDAHAVLKRVVALHLHIVNVRHRLGA